MENMSLCHDHVVLVGPLAYKILKSMKSNESQALHADSKISVKKKKRERKG